MESKRYETLVATAEGTDHAGRPGFLTATVRTDCGAVRTERGGRIAFEARGGYVVLDAVEARSLAYWIIDEAT